jgi:membrane protein DedA with SNARE-associated domain
MVAFIRTNPGWAVFVSGLTAFGESFVFLSLLFPGTAILIASGALISEGVLDPLLPTVAGIGGAVFGDAGRSPIWHACPAQGPWTFRWSCFGRVY